MTCYDDDDCRRLEYEHRDLEENYKKLNDSFNNLERKHEDLESDYEDSLKILASFKEIIENEENSEKLGKLKQLYNISDLDRHFPPPKPTAEEIEYEKLKRRHFNFLCFRVFY